jgi:hypothetical protein
MSEANLPAVELLRTLLEKFENDLLTSLEIRDSWGYQQEDGSTLLTDRHRVEFIFLDPPPT